MCVCVCVFWGVTYRLNLLPELHILLVGLCDDLSNVIDLLWSVLRFLLLLLLKRPQLLLLLLHRVQLRLHLSLHGDEVVEWGHGDVEQCLLCVNVCVYVCVCVSECGSKREIEVRTHNTELTSHNLHKTHNTHKRKYIPHHTYHGHRKHLEDLLHNGEEALDLSKRLRSIVLVILDDDFETDQHVVLVLCFQESDCSVQDFLHERYSIFDSKVRISLDWRCFFFYFFFLPRQICARPRSQAVGARPLAWTCETPV